MKERTSYEVEEASKKRTRANGKYWKALEAECYSEASSAAIMSYFS
jgi:hypothetical protein